MKRVRLSKCDKLRLRFSYYARLEVKGVYIDQTICI